jgi:hypothetical protein
MQIDVQAREFLIWFYTIINRFEIGKIIGIEIGASSLHVVITTARSKSSSRIFANAAECKEPNISCHCSFL